MLRNAKGEPFEFEYLEDIGGGGRAVAVWRRNLDKLGIRIKLREVDFAVMVKRQETFEFDVIQNRTIDFTLPKAADLKDRFGSKNADVPGSGNLRGIKSPAVDHLLERMDSAQTLDELRNASRALDRIIMHGNYQIPDLYSGMYRVSRWDRFGIPLAPRDGARFTLAPGQFNMLLVPGVGEVPISMSGKPGTVREIVHTVRAVGAVTRMLQQARRGTELGVRGPYGTAWPVEAAAGGDVVLVAGGIGLAPLRPALYHVLAHRKSFGRVGVLIGARTPADLLFAREIETWRGRFALDVEVTVDRGGPDWFGPVGVVTTLIPHLHFDPPRTTAFVCGPEIMMTFTVRELERRGVPSARVWVC